jgi:hypothetical protein
MFDKDLKLGPTGDFPHGKLNSGDKGGLNVAISTQTYPDDRTPVVRIDFGTPVDWVCLPPDDAIQFALVITGRANAIKRGEYD